MRTDARKAGDYTFELTVVPINRRRAQPIGERSDVVVIDPKPLPAINSFFASDVFYQEAGTEDQPQEIFNRFSIRPEDCQTMPVEPSEANNGSPEESPPGIPAIDGAGIRLNWCITNIAELASFTLIGRTSDGMGLGEITYNLQQPEGILLPEALANFCEMTNMNLACQNFPTTISQAGMYQFELKKTVQGQTTSLDESAPTEPVLTEMITIAPLAPQILKFSINDQLAHAKYVGPFHTGVFAPPLLIDWAVDGGDTTQVSLLPAPGNVPSAGTLVLPLTPESGSTTIPFRLRMRLERVLLSRLWLKPLIRPSQ